MSEPIWNSVKDKMPDEGVLCVVFNGRKYFIAQYSTALSSECSRHSDGWKFGFCSSCIEVGPVTHWMELPRCYTGIEFKKYPYPVPTYTVVQLEVT